MKAIAISSLASSQSHRAAWGRDEPKEPAPSAKVFDGPRRVTYGTEILTPGIRLLR
jgi:hypothetical protein